MRALRTFGAVLFIALAPSIALAQPSADSGSAAATPDTLAARPDASVTADGAATPAGPTRPLSPEEQAEIRKQFDASLVKRTGVITLPQAHVTLNVPDGYYFLDTASARKVLEEAWGNPPDPLVDGMIFRAGMTPLDDDAWGVVITYEESGYVSDEDAKDIDYDMLMDRMRDGEDAENAARKAKNFQAVRLLGWATQPRYDAVSHKLLWAKELKFEDAPENTLNYDMRVLGRMGVLSLNFVAAMSQLSSIESASAGILAIPHFDQGYRYEDFNATTDPKADYGVVGLIAGGAAAAALAKNAGLIGGLLLALKKFWIVIIAAIAGAGGVVRNLFGGGRQKAAAKAAQRASTAFFDDADGAGATPPADAVAAADVAPAPQAEAGPPQAEAGPPPPGDSKA